VFRFKMKSMKVFFSKKNLWAVTNPRWGGNDYSAFYYINKSVKQVFCSWTNNYSVWFNIKSKMSFIKTSKLPLLTQVTFNKENSMDCTHTVLYAFYIKTLCLISHGLYVQHLYTLTHTLESL